MSGLIIRKLEAKDCSQISQAFADLGWHGKPTKLYEGYLSDQENGSRIFLLAEMNGAFAGYVTVNWTSAYTLFQEHGIPEIQDFNVLPKYRRKGIGTALMDLAEESIKAVSPRSGIGFGVYKDYGAAQILYIKRGYIPDGNGLVKDSLSLAPGTNVVVDDSLVIYLTKEL